MKGKDAGISRDTRKRIAAKALQDPDFFHALLRNPRKALAQLGITITPAEHKALLSRTRGYSRLRKDIDQITTKGVIVWSP